MTNKCDCNCLHFWWTANTMEDGAVLHEIHSKCELPGRCKRVLVLYTGGTIGMQKNEEKGYYVTVPNCFEQKLRCIPEMHSDVTAKKMLGDEPTKWLVLPKKFNGMTVIYTIEEYENLLDSSNMSSEDWIQIATDIENNYAIYDGFVILHGTDTLAYTTSVLSFMINGLQKPVIVTGSMISIFEKCSDAKCNILNSIILAACFDIPEVCTFFARKLMRGNRTTKINSNLKDCFDSCNYGLLGRFKEHAVQLYQTRIAKIDYKISFSVQKVLNNNVMMVMVFPNFIGDIMQSCCLRSIRGIVLLTYGTGNIQSNRKPLLKFLGKLVEKGVIVVSVTQCPHGNVTGEYKTGQVLAEIGVLNGHDMTAEAAFTKLAYILAQSELTLKEQKNLFLTNLRGEMTIP